MRDNSEMHSLFNTQKDYFTPQSMVRNNFIFLADLNS